MYRRQQGLTLISWVFVIAIALLIGTASLRLIPVYLEYLKVSATLDSVKNELSGKEFTLRELRGAIGKRFDIEGVTIIDVKEVNVERSGNAYKVWANYDHRTPFIGNVSFLVSFDKRVEIPI